MNGKNKNVTQHIDKDGKVVTVLWAKGITPPNQDEFKDYVTAGQYLDRAIPQKPNVGWFDTNKAKNPDPNYPDYSLCFAAVASNVVHWWLEQNNQNIERFIQIQIAEGKLAGGEPYAENDIRRYIDSFKGQQDSEIFWHFKKNFSHKSQGFFADILVDYFVNGFTPKKGGGTNHGRAFSPSDPKDPRAGFFHEVFGNTILTDRSYSGSYANFSSKVEAALKDNKLIGLEHFILSYSHIITLWGAEYDLNNNIVGIYVTDSDDQNDEAKIALRRYRVNNVGGEPKITSDFVNPNAGVRVTYLEIISLGLAEWEQYLKNK